MAATGRQLFNEAENICLQELVIKYKLNSIATMGSAVARQNAWLRLTEEYNAIETNSKRTEAHLKKCWDNLKTRRKSMLALEKRERMKTGGGSFKAQMRSTSSQVPVLEDGLAEQIDVIDSDKIPCRAEIQIDDVILLDTSSQVPACVSKRKHYKHFDRVPVD
ncbi:unnamed protein product [Leptidea sinapis]|uniref:Regulatory protein zeste n=1 Tax=Leptidea sinapis TaxID=189913 RepID=A0A5E4R7B5_9NEOP|nr:unnamed protein product [Leptidea sinapis]